MNIFFALPIENTAVTTGHTGYFLPTVEIKDYNVMIDQKNFFEKPVKKLHNNISEH